MTAGELSQPGEAQASQSWFRLPTFSRNDVPMIGISVGHACTHWYPGGFIVMLPFFAADLGLSLTQVGILIGLRSVTSTLINLPGGMIVDMIGKRGLVMGCAIAWAGIPYLFLGLTTNFVIIATLMGDRRRRQPALPPGRPLRPSPSCTRPGEGSPRRCTSSAPASATPSRRSRSASR